MKKIFEKLRGFINSSPALLSSSKAQRAQELSPSGAATGFSLPGRGRRGENIPFKATKHNAFTLTEALTIITVIGFIAAITMQIWRGTTEGKEYDVGVQKMISRLSQALRMNRVTHDFENWNDIFGEEGGDNIQRDLFGRHLKIVKTNDGNEIAEKYSDGTFFNYSDGDGKIYTLKDGVQYSIFSNADSAVKIENEPVKVIMVVDLNGIRKQPNTPGKDIRMIAISENRAAEFNGTGSNSWCGDDCANTSLGKLAVSNLGTDATGRSDAYYDCTNQGLTLASTNEMLAIFNSDSARAKAGISSDKTTCYQVRDMQLHMNFNNIGFFFEQYACYNPTTGESMIVSDASSNSGPNNKFVNSIGSPWQIIDGERADESDFENFYNNNPHDSNIQAVCVKDESTARVSGKYPAAESAIGNKAYKSAHGCFGNPSSPNGIEGCSGSDEITDRATKAQAEAYCEYYGMRLPSVEEIRTEIAPETDSGNFTPAQLNPNRHWMTTDVISSFAEVLYKYDCKEVATCGTVNQSVGSSSHFFCVGD